MLKLLRYFSTSKVMLASERFKSMNREKINLVLLHGILGSKDSFKFIADHPQIQSLCKNIYLVDLRNHGESEQTESMYFGELAEDLMEFMKRQMIKDCCILAHAYGARVTYSYLHHFIDDAKNRLRGVAVIDMLPTAVDNLQVVQYTFDIIKKMHKIKLNRDQIEIEKEIDSIFSSPGIRNLVKMNLIPKDKKLYSWRTNIDGLIEGYMRNVATNHSAQWNGPAIVIKGEKSDHIPENRLKDFLKVFPQINLNKDVHIVKNAGHWVQADQPFQVIHLVKEFLEKI